MKMRLIMLGVLLSLVFVSPASAIPCCNSQCNFWASQEQCNDPGCEDLCSAQGCTGGEQLECNVGTVMCKCGPEA